MLELAPEWMDVVISLLALVVAIIFGVGWWRWPRRKLKYAFLVEPLLMKDVEGFEITFNGEVVSKPYLVKVLIGNTGNRDISVDQFGNNLMVRTERNSLSFLRHELFDACNRSLKEEVKVSYEMDSSAAVISPLILNEDDWLELRFSAEELFENGHQIYVSGRISGIKDIEESPYHRLSGELRNPVPLWYRTTMSVLVIISVGIGILFIFELVPAFIVEFILTGFTFTDATYFFPLSSVVGMVFFGLAGWFRGQAIRSKWN